MDLFEYQGKQLFARYGIPVSAGEAVETVDDAVAAAERVGYPVVVKAQVQVGGRGKAGGIKLAANADEVRTHAGEHPRHGHQGPRRAASSGSSTRPTSPRSTTRRSRSTAARSSTSACCRAQGGVEIEQVADENPDAIARIHVDPVDGLDEAQCRGVGRGGEAEPAGDRRRGRHPDEALHRVRRRRLRPRRDQPADPHARRQGARARRQGRARRQREVPPSRVGRADRAREARRARTRSGREGPAVRRPRRQRRRDRQRRRPRDGDVRHRQRGRRQARQLPRHRRRRERRGDGERARGHQQRPVGEVDLHQHLRRHHQGRRGRQRHRAGARPGRHRLADRHPPRRHQRRAGPRDPEGARVRSTRSANPRWSTPRARPSRWPEEPK